MEALIVFGSIAYLVLWYFIADAFRNIAQMKGNNESRYFWWTFLMGPVGMMMVIALPDRSGVDKSAELPIDELPDL